MNKKQEGMIWSYNARNNYDDIYKAYRSPSIYKVRAWEAIKADCADLKGWGLKVLGKNCMKYSAAFQYASPETGEIRLRYYTASNIYDFAI